MTFRTERSGRHLHGIASLAGTFKENLTSWLADSTNGITDLFAKDLHAETVYADDGYFNPLTAGSTNSLQSLSTHPGLTDVSIVAPTLPRQASVI